MSSTANLRARRQVRTFVMVWMVITVIMGTCTFIAIYAAYGALTDDAAQSESRIDNQAVPASNMPATVAGAGLSPTQIPTRQIAAAASPTTQDSVSGRGEGDIAAQAEATATETLVPSPTPTLLPVDDRVYQVGIQVQVSPDYNADIQNGWMGLVADQLHMEWIKQQVRWENIERERGNFDWFPLDFSLPLAAERNLKVMLSVVTAPDWAREAGVDTSRHGPPANPQDYANFVAEMLRRYPGMIHAVEVWNEQNLDREWTSTRGLSAANYVELLRVTSQAAKAVDPGIIIISGALSPTGLNDGIGAWDDFVYMDQLIAAGMLNYTDCVGAHHNGYNMNPNETWDAVTNDPTASFRGPFDNAHHSWSFRSTLEIYAQKVRAAGGSQKLCVTEFGWASTEDMDGTPPGFEFANDNTLEEQKEWTIDALNNMLEWDIVWLAFVWNLNYGPQAGWDPNNDNVPYSLIGKDFNFRPAYNAVAEWQAEYRQRIGR